jgi:hypothetical protein
MAASIAPAKNVSALIHRRLYRALLRAAKPFTPPSPNAVTLSCLLHRSFVALEWDEKLATTSPQIRYSIKVSTSTTHPLEGSSDDDDSDDDQNDNDDDDDDDEELQFLATRVDSHFLLFRRLLWTLFSDGDTYHYSTDTRHPAVVPCYQQPQHVQRQPTKLRDMIRREFRVKSSVTHEEPDQQGQQQPSASSFLSEAFPVATRRETAFLTLRKLNEKLAWEHQLLQQQQVHQTTSSRKINNHNRSPKQAAKHVDKIEWNRNNLSSCLTPGTYLVAHPLMTGFFRKTVICILQHGTAPAPVVKDGGTTTGDVDVEDDSSSSNDLGTYGVIVNRVSTKETNGNPLTLSEALPLLPKMILASIGALPVKEGGPVHMPSIQMIHMSSTSSSGDGSTGEKDVDQKDYDIGGITIPSVTEQAEDKVVSYKGDIMKAAYAVASGILDKGTCEP